MKNILIGMFIGIVISLSVYHFTRTQIPQSVYDMEHIANKKYVDSLNSQLEIYKSSNILLLNDFNTVQHNFDSLNNIKNSDALKIKQLQADLLKIRSTPTMLPPNDLLIQLRNKFNN